MFFFGKNGPMFFSGKKRRVILSILKNTHQGTDNKTPWEKEDHLQTYLGWGYVSSRDGRGFDVV